MALHLGPHGGAFGDNALDSHEGIEEGGSETARRDMVRTERALHAKLDLTGRERRQVKVRAEGIVGLPSTSAGAPAQLTLSFRIRAPGSVSPEPTGDDFSRQAWAARHVNLS